MSSGSILYSAGMPLNSLLHGSDAGDAVCYSCEGGNPGTTESAYTNHHLLTLGIPNGIPRVNTTKE